MTENADKTRALRAEKQVERLERELEAVKSRGKVKKKISAFLYLSSSLFSLMQKINKIKIYHIHRDL